MVITAVPQQQLTLKAQILDLSRQNNIAPLSEWFDRRLDAYIAAGLFPSEEKLVEINASLTSKARAYLNETPVNTATLGMSGGVNSALTAGLLKNAGFRVVGVTMPINQNPEETDRGVEACKAIGIEHLHIDLSSLYEATLNTLGGFGLPFNEALDPRLVELLGDDADAKVVRIRRGNIRARLRMITLYNLASMFGGMVASTDNLSELGAGFWTLHGDVGDFSPIQSLTKSWEVPYLARLNGVPESTVRATPTDGLGISPGDEAQLGCTYLEWDIMMFAISDGWRVVGEGLDHLKETLDLDERGSQVFDAVMSRMGATWYKRKNPLNVPHPFHDRYGMIDRIDGAFFVPQSMQG